LKIYEWSREHPLSILMLCGAFLLFGVISFFELEMEELPEKENTGIVIISKLPGYPAEEIEALITIPLENSLSGISDIKDMESISSRGYSKILIQFDWGADMYQSSVSVRECVDGLYPYLPGGMEKPLVISNNLATTPVIMLTVKPDSTYEGNDFYSILNSNLKNRIQQLDEIASVRILGLKKPEIHIELDMDALSVRGLSIAETASILSSFLVSKTAGRVTENKIRRLVSIESGINTIRDIEELQLFPGTGIKDIGEISELWEEQDSIYLLNGEEAWGLYIYKNASSTTNNAAEAVKEILPLLIDEYSGRLKFQIIDDESVRIRKNIKSLFLSLFSGLAAAFLVLFLLNNQFYQALITAVSILFTLILNFFFLYIFKISLNTISLYGMIAALGLIADNNIVVLHELENGDDIQNISSALLTSTLTTVIVFLPPLFVPGPTSVLFGDLVLTVIFTVALSLPVSLFFTPALYRILNNKNEYSTRQTQIMGNLRALYLKILTAHIPSGRYFRISRLIFLIIFPAVLLLLKLIPFELFPHRQNNKILLSTSLPANYSPEQISAEAASISKGLLSDFVLQTVIIESEAPDSTNSTLSSSIRGGLNQIKILIIHENRLSTELQKKIYEYCRETLFLKDCSLQPLPGTFQIFDTENRGINLSSSEVEKLYSMKLPQGATEYGSNFVDVYYFKTDSQRLKASNITPLSIHSELRARIEGISAGQLKRAEEKINILVRADKKYRSSIKDLGRTTIAEPPVSLHLLGSFTENKCRDILYRKNQNYIRTIRTTSAEKNESLENRLRDSLPDGIEILKEENTELNRLAYLYSLSLVLLFLVLGTQTGSLKKAILLYLFIPPAIFGALTALFLFRQSLNIYSFLGLLILQGTVVNSGILLMSSLDKSPVDEKSVHQGAVKRLKPVIGSCLCTVTALIPVLISSFLSGNGESGMALALMGGLLYGTIQILILLPPFYLSMVSMNEK
jgi:hydrophobic/amphiphilic exporter-1 (mainly G- bacteria), HAE1 family